MVSFRPFAGAADFEHFARISNRCNVSDGVEIVETAAGFANEYTHLANTDLARDVLVAEADGVPVAYQRTTWKVEEDGTRLYWLYGCVDPAWQRRGLGRELLRRGEARLRAVAAEHAAEAPKFFTVYSPRRRVGKVALFESAGYRAVRHFYLMERPLSGELPEARLPAGLALRAVQPEHLRALWDANEEAFRDHWGFTAQGDEGFEAWRDNPQSDHSLWQAAWDVAREEVAGLATNVIDPGVNAQFGRQLGTVEELSVRRPWRRRGVGRALLAASLRAFRARGMTEAAIGVDSKSSTGAPHLYESVGFQTVNQSLILRKRL